MTSQPMNMRRAFGVVRRNKTLIGVAAAIGLLAGAAYGSISPPMQTAEAIVVLPAGPPAMATELVIAKSTPVLAGALPNVSPAMTADTLHSRVSVSSPANDILQFTVGGGTVRQAERNANAVANSYIAYVNSSESPIGRVVARMLAPANSATGTSPLVHRVSFGLVGTLIGFLVGFVLALARGRGSRKLRLRDEIANSIGVPVLASVPAGHPSSMADWAKLLRSYQPTPLYAWRLRKALQQLNVSGVDLTRARDNGTDRSSVAVVSLTGDRGALAMGPQLAVFAASLGIPTALIVGPHQDPGFAATLRTTCAEWQRQQDAREGLLHVVTTDDPKFSGCRDAMLRVIVSVVNADAPEVGGTIRGTTTVVGVSPAVVTADQLAKVAVSAAAADRNIAGFLVANPDPVDHTSGRIPQLLGIPQAVVPTRLTGTVTEAKR